MKRFSPADRDVDAIAALVARVLPGPTRVLEVGAGAGQHSVGLAAKLPWLTWIPSDSHSPNVDSAAAWRAEAALPNLRAPILLDVTDDPWDAPPFGAIVAIHLVCGAPWAVGVSLLGGAGRHLPPGGRLIVVGEGQWGDHDLNQVMTVADARGLTLEEHGAVGRDVGEVWKRR